MRVWSLPLLTSAAYFALLGVACTRQAGATSEDVGAPCEDDVECASDSYCDDSAAFPDGMCTIECDGQEDCILSTVCSQRGMCLIVCNEDSDCREGYSCIEVDRTEGLASVRACATDV